MILNIERGFSLKQQQPEPVRDDAPPFPGVCVFFFSPTLRLDFSERIDFTCGGLGADAIMEADFTDVS